MLDALFRSPDRPGHIVIASSRAVYGEGQWKSGDQTYYAEPRAHEDLAVSQWDPPSPDGGRAVPLPSQAGHTEPRPTNIYAATKLAQENILTAWTAATGTALSVLRLQNVYGPGQSLINSYTGILALFSRLAVSKEQIDLYEDGCALRDFVYIGDVVQALVCALDSPPSNGACSTSVRGRRRHWRASPRSWLPRSAHPRPTSRVNSVRGTSARHRAMSTRRRPRSDTNRLGRWRPASLSSSAGSDQSWLPRPSTPLDSRRLITELWRRRHLQSRSQTPRMWQPA